LQNIFEMNPISRGKLFSFCCSRRSPLDSRIPNHGFIYYHGMWANLEYPGANETNPPGISDAGVIVGNSSSPDGSARAFLYQNGVFKSISVPNSTGSYVVASSLRKGSILGIAYSHSVVGGQEGYIAKCN
jgi:probable HAF family extracellular repeat protein